MSALMARRAMYRKPFREARIKILEAKIEYGLGSLLTLFKMDDPFITNLLQGQKDAAIELKRLTSTSY